MFGTSSEETRDGQSMWWCERELAFVLFLGIVTFCARLDSLPLFGEEPRRALIAREMVETGDWLVPGTQRVFLPSRPPLQNWLIAVTGLLTGSFDIWSARIPSIISTNAIAILLYGYLRLHVGRLGSLSGAVAFLTMTLVLEFGRSAETEAVFSLFVAASLILWHWGWVKKWPAWQIRSVGYVCAALGMLTKGLQAPLYFVGATWLFLIAIGKWREIITRAQFMGLFLFVAAVSAWQLPFTWNRGISDSLDIYFEDVAGRFVDPNWLRFLEHLVAYPIELLGVRLMPWCILLLAYANRHVRESVGTRRETVVFMTICISFSFVSVWLPPGSKVRYYMPIVPCFAALIGIAIDRLAALSQQSPDSKLWIGFIKLMSQLMVGSAVVVLAVSCVLPSSRISLEIPAALAFSSAAVALAVISWKSLKERTDRGMSRGVICVAVFMAMAQVGLVVTVQHRRCEDIAGQIERLKSQLPADAKLVSLGPVHHAFAFFYQQPIPIVSLPVESDSENFDYFCLHINENDPSLLTFKWSEVAVVSCDRFKSRSIPVQRVIIGRRISEERIDLNDQAETVEHPHLGVGEIHASRTSQP